MSRPAMSILINRHTAHVPLCSNEIRDIKNVCTVKLTWTYHHDAVYYLIPKEQFYKLEFSSIVTRTFLCYQIRGNVWNFFFFIFSEILTLKFGIIFVLTVPFNDLNKVTVTRTLKDGSQKTIRHEQYVNVHDENDDEMELDDF